MLNIINVVQSDWMSVHVHIGANGSGAYVVEVVPHFFFAWAGVMLILRPLGGDAYFLHTLGRWG
jgi:hypothetical protein